MYLLLMNVVDALCYQNKTLCCIPHLHTYVTIDFIDRAIPRWNFSTSGTLESETDQRVPKYRNWPTSSTTPSTRFIHSKYWLWLKFVDLFTVG